MVDEVNTSDASVARALANVRRQELLLELGEPVSLSQLAHRLEWNKGSVSHHLRILVDAGLARRSGARTVRGGTEVFFERVTSRTIIGDADRSGSTSVMTEALLGAIARDSYSHLNHRTIRLTPRQAAHLARHLDALVEGLQPATSPAPKHGVMVGVYRREGFKKPRREPSSNTDAATK